MSETDAYLPALTGLRGVAATWVLLFHLWQFAGSPSLAMPIGAASLSLTPLVRCGFMGVDLFFVLSGFLLAIPFHRAALGRSRTPRLATYWRRRCRRVLPAYYAQLIILVAVFAAWGQTEALGVANLGAHALLIQNFFAASVPLNGVYWTMPIEWDFYVVLPLMAWVLARLRPLPALAAMIGLSVGFRWICVLAAGDLAWPQWIDYSRIMQLPARLDEFFCGVLGAWWYLRRPLSGAAARTWVAAGLLGIACCMAFWELPGNFLAEARTPWVLVYFTCTGFAFGMLVRGAAGQPAAGAVWFGGRALAWLGLISYSLYLWHYPLLLALAHFDLLASGGAFALLRNALVALPPILLVSWLSQYCVERPFLASARRSG